MDFLIGGLAATCAGVFSNPFDVIKTRQQLQGELQQRKKGIKQPYGSQWQAIKSIVKAEGLFGLQKGDILRDSQEFYLSAFVLPVLFSTSAPDRARICVSISICIEQHSPWAVWNGRKISLDSMEWRAFDGIDGILGWRLWCGWSNGGLSIIHG